MSTNTTQPPRLGQLWPEQGGVYAGLVRGINGAPDFHLIVPTEPAACKADIAWGAQGTDEPGANSINDGLANTRALVQSAHPHPAAKWAAGLEIGAFNDFYLPSQCELMLCFLNAREVFEPRWYWSSTQYSRHNAWFQYFVDGTVYFDASKVYEGRARAVRRFIP